MTKSESLPAWGAWVEISSAYNDQRAVTSRSPHGERGLKLQIATPPRRGRSTSLPAWGAWVEILVHILATLAEHVASRMGSVG